MDEEYTFPTKKKNGKEEGEHDAEITREGLGSAKADRTTEYLPGS
jgi:hypothetical protein